MSAWVQTTMFTGADLPGQSRRLVHPGGKRSTKTAEPIHQRCAHCGRACNNFAGGSSKVGNKLLCHPNVGNRPDCYALVSRYNHTTPCDGTVCYEDHADLMTYVNGYNSYKSNDKVPF